MPRQEKQLKVKNSRPPVNYVPVKEFTKETDLKLLYLCFSALVDHSYDQKIRFAQKKSTVLSGSKYASRTLRNDGPLGYDDESYYSEDQRIQNVKNGMG